MAGFKNVIMALVLVAAFVGCDAEQKPAEPAKIRRESGISELVPGSAPWVDGELTRLIVKSMAEKEVGTLFYSAQQDTSDSGDIWRITSHNIIPMSDSRQYTEVTAEYESFTPLSGRLINLRGDFSVVYGKDNIKLQATGTGIDTTLEIALSGTVYDNEQVVFLIRRMPLQEGFENTFTIFSAASGVAVDCRIKVTGREMLQVPAGKFDCYKAELTMGSEEASTLQHSLWLSADEHKYLVRYFAGGQTILDLAEVTQVGKNVPSIFEDEEHNFSIAAPAGWRFYRYSDGRRSFLEMIAKELKAKAVLCSLNAFGVEDVRQLAEKDVNILKGVFKDYSARDRSWKSIKIHGSDAVQYIADFQELGTRLAKYTQPKNIVEYRTYFADGGTIHWFVFRAEKDKFEAIKEELDGIINSFELYKTAG